MASLNVYLPDDIKEKMAKFPQANWSMLCRQAIENEINRLQLEGTDDVKPHEWSDTDWISESLEQIPDKAVIEESPEKYPGKTLPAKQWVQQTNQAFQRASTTVQHGTNITIQKLLDGKVQVEILKPYSDWQTAYLHLDAKLSLRYRQADSEKSN